MVRNAERTVVTLDPSLSHLPALGLPGSTDKTLPVRCCSVRACPID